MAPNSVPRMVPGVLRQAAHPRTSPTWAGKKPGHGRAFNATEALFIDSAYHPSNWVAVLINPSSELVISTQRSLQGINLSSATLKGSVHHADYL